MAARLAARKPTAPSPEFTRRLMTATATLLCLPLLIGAVGCEIEKPALPTFTTTLNIPVGEERIEMVEVIEGEDYISVGDDDLLSFNVTGDPDTVTLDLDLRAQIGAADIDIEVGNYSLDVADSASFAFSLGELYPDAILLDGLTLDVPPFDFDLTGSQETYEGLVSADVTSGQLVVTLINGLPLPLSGPSPPAQIRVTLLNATSGTSIAEVVFPDVIAPNSQATATANLAGAVLTGNVAVQLIGGSQGSAGPVTIHAADGLAVSAKLRDLSVSNSLAEIGPQNFQTDYRTALPDTIRLVEAEILSGTLNFDLSNGLPIPGQVQLLWHEILNATGQPLVASFWLPAQTTQQHSLDLAGTRVYSPSGTPLDSLGVTVTVDSPGSGGVPVQLRYDDRLQAAVASTELSLGTITGSIPTQTFTFDPLTEDVDLPDELANISLTAASLVLRVDNGAGMPAQIVMTVTGTAEDGSKATLDLAAYIAPAPEQDPLQTVVVLDQTNSDIVPFLNNKPETITLEGDVLVGGETVIGTIRPGDYAVLSWEISAPLEVIIAETIIAGDPDQLNLGEDTKELISDHAMSARMIAEITNHLPVAVDLTIYVSDDTLTMISDPLLTVRLMDVAAGQLDPLLHTVSAPTVSRPEINLTREEILVFGLPDRDLFTLLEVTLPGSGDPVRLRATDYLQVNGLVSLDIRTTD